MKPEKLIVLLLILLLSRGICQAQNYFVNTYGLYANPCLSIVCADSCFFSAVSNMAGNTSFLTFKTDPAGNILWSREVSIANAPYIMLNHIAQAADGGYLILGYTQIPGLFYSYQTVIKLDQTGNFLWSRCYYSTSSNVAYSIIKNNDNGYMLTGGGCNGNNYVIKCTQNGDIVWQKGYTSGPGCALNIATHDYNHFMVSGYSGTDLVFFEIDTLGNLSWQSVITISNQGIGTFSLKPTLDNGYIGTGQVTTNSSGGNQAFIIKLNQSGVMSWLKIYKVLNSESIGNDIAENADSSILMVGFSSTSYMKGLMVKIDKNGNFIFAKGEPDQQSYSEYNSVNRISAGRILLSGQCQNDFQPTFIAVTDDSFSSFCNIAGLSISDSVPAASCSFITNTPVDLSFQSGSLTVAVAPHPLVKNVLCSSAVVPTVTTGSATVTSLSSAYLKGMIIPSGDTVAGFFEYGTTVSYGTIISASPDTVTGNSLVQVGAALNSLNPWTVYHYRCLATDGINTYYGNDSEFITCLPTGPVISGKDSLCPNSGFYSYQTQSGFMNYQWETSAGGTITYGQGTPDLQVYWQQSGDQWVRATFMDSLGCAAVTPTVFPVFVKYLPNPAGPITGLPTVCEMTEGVSYHADEIPGAIAYVWTLPPGITVTQGQWTNEILVDFNDSCQSGFFFVNGNNLCGNGSISPAFPVTINRVPPDPFILQSGDTLFSNAHEGNQWFLNQQPIPGALDAWHIPVVNGDYSVMVNLNGCFSDTSNIISYILLNNETAGVKQHFTVYPNPSSGRFYLQGPEFSETHARVYNLTGKIVYDGIIKMNRLELKDLPRGLYLLIITTVDGNSNIKIQIAY